MFAIGLPSYLGDAQLAGGQLLLVLVHLVVALRLCALQLLAALRHGLHFALHLADVETSHCELLVYQAAAALVLLEQPDVESQDSLEKGRVKRRRESKASLDKGDVNVFMIFSEGWHW